MEDLIVTLIVVLVLWDQWRMRKDLHPIKNNLTTRDPSEAEGDLDNVTGDGGYSDVDVGSASDSSGWDWLGLFES